MAYSLLIDEHYQDFSENAAKKEVYQLIQKINQASMLQLRKEVEFEIRVAKDSTAKKDLLKKLIQLNSTSLHS
ncbi:hypothetical protein IPJ72_01760 [Candidatus Peregrinibacteria bacterium]|nr:MAG: hypothetical protein IPJ72_01760 [Candidatus Peregrinibacteria bacterium]